MKKLIRLHLKLPKAMANYIVTSYPLRTLDIWKHGKLSGISSSKLHEIKRKLYKKLIAKIMKKNHIKINIRIGRTEMTHQYTSTSGSPKNIMTTLMDRIIELLKLTSLYNQIWFVPFIDLLYFNYEHTIPLIILVVDMWLKSKYKLKFFSTTTYRII